MSDVYERLPVRDRAFLVFETATAPMHIGGTMIFDATPLATPEGGVDIARIRARIGASLHAVPRYRQRLATIAGQLVWVDDDHFDLGYHVRHTRVLPRGDEAQLKQLSAEIFAQPLDRARPLWEFWIVDGLHGGVFAVVLKIHHCITNGVAAMDLLTVLLSFDAAETFGAPPAWQPRALPSREVLRRDKARRRTQMLRALAQSIGGLLRRRAAASFRVRWPAVRRTIATAMQRRAPTPLNQPIGTQRRVDGLALDLNELKAIRTQLGGTVNDVVLAAVAGAMRRFFALRGAAVDGLDYRAVVPVDLRARGDSERASVWVMSLPVDEADARRRHATVCAATAQLKTSQQELGLHWLLDALALGGARLFTFAIRWTARRSPYHLLVTNIPGPSQPLFLLGARLIGGYPLGPLFEDQAVTFAFASYCGQFLIGLNADPDLVPDLEKLVDAVRVSFQELSEAAGLNPAAIFLTPSLARPTIRRDESAGRH